MKLKLIGENNPTSYMEQIAKNRGMELEEMLFLFNIGNYESCEIEHHYSLLNNVDKAVDILIKANNNKWNVKIIVDSDADGYTSASAFYNYIQSNLNNINLSYFVHENEKSKEHGVFNRDIEDGIDLVIVPDAGTQSLDEIKKIRARDIEVLVADHHNLEENDRDIVNHCIIVNNQMCDYPNKTLSGVGVVYKILQGLDDSLGIDKAKDYLDLVAIGMIADLMKITDKETRYYCLKGIEKFRNPFLIALKEKQSFVLGNDPITFKDISWSIAPLINATVRYGSLEERKDMFEAFIEGNDKTLPYKKRGAENTIEQPIAEAMARICGNVKNRQDKAYKKIVEDLVEVGMSKDDKLIAIDATEHLEGTKGSLSGLVAMNLSERLQKPTLIYKSFSDNEIEKASGSGRNFDYSPIDSLQDFLLDLSLFEFVKGHDNAFGHSIEKEKLPIAIEKANEKLKDIDFTKAINVDYVIDMSEINSERAYTLGSLNNQWGSGMQAPMVAIENIELPISDIYIRGKNQDTVAFNIDGIDFVKFKVDENTVGLLSSENTSITLVGSYDLNTYNGITKPQIKIVDWEVKKIKPTNSNSKLKNREILF